MSFSVTDDVICVWFVRGVIRFLLLLGFFVLTSSTDVIGEAFASKQVKLTAGQFTFIFIVIIL